MYRVIVLTGCVFMSGHISGVLIRGSGHISLYYEWGYIEYLIVLACRL